MTFVRAPHRRWRILRIAFYEASQLSSDSVKSTSYCRIAPTEPCSVNVCNGSKAATHVVAAAMGGKRTLKACPMKWLRAT